MKTTLIALISLIVSGFVFADPAKKDGKKVLNVNGAGNLIMAYADLSESGEHNIVGGGARKQDMDIVVFPECKAGGKNKPVSALKVVVTPKKRFGPQKNKINRIAYVKNMSVIFDNGNAQTIKLDGLLYSGDSTRFYDLNGNNRCIRALAINGEEAQSGQGSSQVTIIGRR